MKNKSLSLIYTIIIFSLAVGFSCSNSDEKSADSNQNDAQNVSQTSSSSPRQGNYGRKQQQQQHFRGRRQMGRQADTDSNPKVGNKDKIPSFVSLTKAEEKAVNIETAVAKSRPMSNNLVAMAKILPNQYRKAIVSYPFSARVAQIDAKIGDHVKKGQKLIVLQSEEVGEAISAFYKAKADHELARVNFDREHQLFDKGVGAKKTYIAAEAELNVAEVNLDAAEKKLHVLGFSETDVKMIGKSHQINPIITLYSPIEGTIVKSDMILGGMVDESTEILSIMDLSVLWVDAEIYEKDIATIKIGQDVEVKVPAYPEESFMGKITYISDLLNESSRTITVRSEVKNRNQKLKPGMFASLNIVLNLDGNVLTIPFDAVLDDNGKKMVFVKIDGEYHPREVNVGAKNGDFITINSGIQEGDIIVTSGNFQLKSKLYEEILNSAGVH